MYKVTTKTTQHYVQVPITYICVINITVDNNEVKLYQHKCCKTSLKHFITYKVYGNALDAYACEKIMIFKIENSVGILAN